MARSRSRIHLMPDERENVDALVAETQAEVGTGDTGFMANKAVARLTTAAERGAAWARTALEYFAEQGLQVYIKDEMRGSDTSIMRDPKTGNPVGIPSRIGIQARNDDGIKEHYHQQEFWWVPPWPVLIEKIANYIKQRNTLDTNIAIFGEVVKLRDRYPETLTPEEACEMAGIDPRSFGIEGNIFAAS